MINCDSVNGQSTCDLPPPPDFILAPPPLHFTCDDNLKDIVDHIASANDDIAYASANKAKTLIYQSQCADDIMSLLYNHSNFSDFVVMPQESNGLNLMHLALWFVATFLVAVSLCTIVCVAIKKLPNAALKPRRHNREKLLAKNSSETFKNGRICEPCQENNRASFRQNCEKCSATKNFEPYASPRVFTFPSLPCTPKRTPRRSADRDNRDSGIELLPVVHSYPRDDQQVYAFSLISPTDTSNMCNSQSNPIYEEISIMSDDSVSLPIYMETLKSSSAESISQPIEQYAHPRFTQV